MKTDSPLMPRLVDELAGYVQHEITAARLKLYRNASVAAGEAASFSLIAIAGIFFMFFLSCGIAIWIGESTGSLKTGFLIIAGVYLVTGVVVLSLRRTHISRTVTDKAVTRLSGLADLKELEAAMSDNAAKTANAAQMLRSSVEELKVKLAEAEEKYDQVSGLFRKTNTDNGKSGSFVRPLVGNLIRSAVLGKAGWAGIVVPVVAEGLIKSAKGGLLSRVGSAITRYVMKGRNG